MKAYLLNEIVSGPRNISKDVKLVSKEQLEAIGVYYAFIPSDERLEQNLDNLCAEKGYKNRDEVKISPSTLANYNEKMKIFYEEHIHADEEVRYVKAGSGFFDVRDEKDQWVRIHVTTGDLLILPAGIYHRFTTDESDFIHAIRIFKEDPKWTPINRSSECDELEIRRNYLELLNESKLINR